MASHSTRRLWLWATAAAGIALAVIAVAQGPRLYRTALLGSGYSAEILCGGVFVSGRDADTVIAEDLTGPGFDLLAHFTSWVDREGRRVTSSLYGLAKQTAFYRDGLGCTLIDGKTESELRAETAELFAEPLPPASGALWPDGERVDLDSLDPDIDKSALDAGVAAAFAEPDPTHPHNTRALVVVHKGRIVAERYAPGFAAEMPLIGWSMTKAALNALIGLRVKDGKLTVGDEDLLPEWIGSGDPRSDISLDDLLRMSSGLAFDEGYGDPLADVTQMLFVAPDKVKFAAEKPLLYPPGEHFDYASGTSVILAGILRGTFRDEDDYLRYPRERLFGPLFMRSALIEPDAAGTFVASSLMYATARDFARLGLLYLQDGVWQGERILPEGWVAYSLTPTKGAPDASYGAHIWLKLPESERMGEPPMPADAYYFLGHEEQIVAIVPSRELLIVRLGRTPEGGAWDHARDLAPIVAAFPPH
jgi:CubicO group peptidase (beta-lactamase class C family)